MKMKNNKKKKGFTLIELIVVIAILAILAAVAVPNFIGIMDKANIATEVAAASEFVNAINIYNATKPTAIADGVLTATTNLTVLTTANLMPKTDIDLAKVLPRITIAGGVASVTNKNKI